MAPQLELHYFAIRGKALPIRLALFHSGLEFKDVRHTHGSADYKEIGPMGALPIMKIDDNILSQSFAIMNYVSTITDLGFKDNLEQARVMEVMGICDDILMRFYMTIYCSDEEEKKSKRMELCKELIPTMLDKFDKFIGKYGKNGFSLCDRLSMADFCIFAMIDYLKAGFLDHVDVKLTDPYKNLIAVFEKVKALPKVNEWMVNKEGWKQA